jgi:CubicO group peptidase (beta-lactamase class C family)
MKRRLNAVFARIERFIRDGEIDGGALAVAHEGDVVVEAYFGEAAPDQPATAETLWPLASISKLYTAAAVMALVERGQLTLGTTVHDILPAFSGDGREAITIRHLLTHTSGLPYESPSMVEVLLRQPTVDEIVDEALTQPLQFTPGSRFNYSDFGIGLAGRVASTVSEMTFPDLVRILVLDPGGLRETYIPPVPSDYPRLAHVVGSLADGTDSAMYNSPYALALGHPAFGAVASVRDLLRFGLRFTKGSKRPILSEATIRKMTTDQTSGAIGNLIEIGPDGPRPWGFGFAVSGGVPTLGFGDLASPSAFGHPGASGCTLVVDPEFDIALAFVSNRHLRTDLSGFVARLDTVVNGVLAAMTWR